LTLVCGLSIAFAAMGLLTACFGLASLAVSAQLQQAIAAAQKTRNPAANDVQNELNARTVEITKKYNAFSIPLTIVKLPVELTLLTGGVVALWLKPWGRSLLLGALAVAALFDVVAAIPNTLMQREIQTVFADTMPRLMAAQRGPARMPPGAGNLMTSYMTTVQSVTLVFLVAWLAGKIVLAAFGIQYLRKPAVAALFAPSTPAGDAPIFPA
jgi:hypothetical protein